METTREGGLPGSLVPPREGKKADGDGVNAPEAHTTASCFSGEMLEGLSGASGRGMHGEYASRTWETLEGPAPQGSREVAPTTRRTAEDLRGGRAAHRTS